MLKYSIKTITEYSILRYKIRDKIFKGFNVKKISDFKQYDMKDVDINIYLEDIDKIIYVFIVDILGIKNLRKYLSIFENNIYNQELKTELIIIYLKKTTESEKCIKDKKTYMLDTFSQNELQYNIFKNELLHDKIRLLNNEEKMEIMKYYKIQNWKKFPIILYDDKICRYLGCKKYELLLFYNNYYYIRCVI